jgi:serine/threonine protein kinase
MPSRVGEKFGHYKLARLLGEGGFAEVYLGEHIHLGSEAAIKVLHGQLTSKEREEFRREAITLAHLIHPHIVRLLDFGFEDKTPYLVMDYAPNGTLRQRHPKGTRIPPEVLLPYVRQIAYALQFAHDQRLVHRDIKPENMLVGRQQEIVLSDFGLAIVSQSSRSYNDKDKAGTATYMAPEQFEGKLHPASDQYALAIVVYEWLRGEPPFNVGNFIQLGYQHTYIAPPPLHESLPAIAPTAEQVVLKALTKDPAQRWPSVKAFAEALERAM